MTYPMIKNKSRILSESAACERLLNAYLREMGIFDPSIRLDHPSLNVLSSSEIEEMKRQGLPMRVQLPASDAAIFGAIGYFSPFGHHRYGSSFWLQKASQGQIERISHVLELGEALLEEMSAIDPNESERPARVRSLLERIENSIQKTVRYVERNLPIGGSLWDRDGEERFSAAEQSLVYGHPFHPSPKSSEGFSPDDLERYAPELGASFVLHYFAAAPELVEEDFLDKTEQDLFPADVLDAARKQLNSYRQHYRLIPCHPWQAQYLKEWPEVRELLEKGQLEDLGPLGHPVYPTSSIRTVWDPEHPYFFKLPLNVRITNFIRVNPPEQLKRTMDASRVLESLSHQLPHEDFTVLIERGYRTVVLPEASGQRNQLAESFAVIFRENPVVRPFAGDSPVVVATLLEHPPHAEEPLLMEAIRMAAKERNLPLSDFLLEWLERYIEISLVPLLSLFIERGISMEAHVQNSMVTLAKGWPECFYVRDLEGVSISRERAEQWNYYGGRLAEDSCALYSDQEAWSRLKYYVVVNHFGHLLHTLAYCSKIDEEWLWQKAGDILRKNDLFRGAEKEKYLLDLLEGEGLPAKANMISSFQKRGESPLYVLAPNLFTKSEVKI